MMAGAAGAVGNPLVSALFGGLAALVLLLGLLRCGRQEPSTAYQGSKCPRCGRKNWIWPWNF